MDEGGALVKLRLVAPRARDLRGPLSLQEQFSFDGCRMRLVQIPPALFPDLRATRPSPAVAREQHFQRFGKARLARSVPADHHSESRPGREVDLLCRTDATESLHGD